MSSTVSTASEVPAWLSTLLGVPEVTVGQPLTVRGTTLVLRDGMLRGESVSSSAQRQTEGAFGFKWQKRDTFESETSLARMRAWLIERYTDVALAPWLAEHGSNPLLLDAGCGAAMSALELFAPVLNRMRYLGVDISEAVDVAAARFSERGLPGTFMQADLVTLPLPPASVDLIFSEGVLHHTDSTENALKQLTRLLKPGGRFLFYVYRRKGPVREFTDDHIRALLQGVSGPEAWAAMMPLTRLGKLLGDLDATIDIPEAIDLLGIPAGKTTVQRLFYWHVAKAFHHPDMTLEELNHINFDWYAPRNAHRQSPDEVRRWCSEAGLVVEREVVEDAGITIIARKEA